MFDGDRERWRLVRHVRRRLLAGGLPRLEMALVAALTGAAGFVASAALLAAGVDGMPLRYGLAVLLAYLVLFLVLRVWIVVWKRGMRDDVSLLDLGGLDIPDGGLGGEFDGGGGSFGGGGASSSFSPPEPAGASAPDAGFDLDLGEGIVIAVVLTLVASALFASLWTVWTAPTLFAELLVDAGISVGLYQRFRHVPEGAWLTTAFRHTVLPFTIVLLVFVLGGAFLQTRYPEARSLGDVVDAVRAPDALQGGQVD